jgi:hypothetical protein
MLKPDDKKKKGNGSDKKKGGCCGGSGWLIYTYYQNIRVLTNSYQYI